MTLATTAGRIKDTVVRGPKLHITSASLGHELVTIPTKAMKAGEEDCGRAAMSPVDAPGVRIVDTTYASASITTSTGPRGLR